MFGLHMYSRVAVALLTSKILTSNLRTVESSRIHLVVISICTIFTNYDNDTIQTFQFQLLRLIDIIRMLTRLKVHNEALGPVVQN